jgi:hypothetical protein
VRAIQALQFPDVSPAEITSLPPDVRLVDPRELWVDERYQRGLSERSMKLIRKIVGEWDWAAFKPPVVVEVEGKLQVIDGQHTAIGAVTHGGIEQLPVLIVQADRQELRANAFVRHNRDRIQVTPTQLHNAMVAAGDEDALTIAQVCERAGVTILKNAPPFARFKPGETMAISTIRALVNRRHALGARKVLEVCAKGGGSPGICRADPRRRASSLRKGIRGRDRGGADIAADLGAAFHARQRGETLRNGTESPVLAGACLGHLHEPQEGARQWIG